MLRRARNRDHHSVGPPRPVVVLLIAELVAVVIMLVLGVPAGDVLKLGAPVITLTLALLNPTVQELGRRQPKLLLSADHADAGAVIQARSLPPWPVCADRIAANELAEARATVSAASRGFRAAFHRVEPFVVPPSEAEHQQARDAFEKQLADYEPRLRQWLDDYTDGASAHARTFQLTLTLSNKRGGAYAESVAVVLDLPETVSLADEWPTVPLPPERPAYEPPQPRSLRAGALVGAELSPFTRARVRDPLPAFSPEIFTRGAAPEPAWKVSPDGKQLEALVPEIHSERLVRVAEPLLLRPDAPGEHQMAWRAYSKSARRVASGTFTLVVPSDDAVRPAFGRLDGIMSFPDVPITGSDGEIVHPVRTADPPLAPPPSKTDDDGDGPAGILARLNEARKYWDWSALGLDPAEDGVDEPAVRRAGSSSPSSRGE